MLMNKLQVLAIGNTGITNIMRIIASLKILSLHILHSSLYLFYSTDQYYHKKCSIFIREMKDFSYFHLRNESTETFIS